MFVVSQISLVLVCNVSRSVGVMSLMVLNVEKHVDSALLFTM